MPMNTTGIYDSNGVYALDSPLSKRIKFWLIIICETSSIPCYLFVIYQYLYQKELRKAIQNHALMVKLCINFVILTIDLSMHLSFLRLGYVLPSTPGACLLWQLVDYGFWFGDIFLTCWMSIERYILIFYSHWANTPYRCIFIHYIPLIFFSLYCPVVYIYLIFFYPVAHAYDYSFLLCGGPYFYLDIAPWLIWYESLVHYVIPIFVIVILSGAMIIRVLIQKYRLRQIGRWNKYRKMLIQFICISAVYIFDLPYIIVTIVRWSGLTYFGTDVQGPYFYYVNYIPTILLSFTLLGTIPHVKTSFIALIYRKKQNMRASVAPHMNCRV
ncbi:unnamed protein product [Rotaria socialis]